VHRGFWLGTLREGDHSKETGVGGSIMLILILRKWDGAWSGLIWLSVGTGGGDLQTR